MIVYAIVLMGMVIASFFRFWSKPLPTVFWLVSAGALFFMVSDSVLAINKFSIAVRTGRGHSLC